MSQIMNFDRKKNFENQDPNQKREEIKKDLIKDL